MELNKKTFRNKSTIKFQNRSRSAPPGASFMLYPVITWQTVYLGQYGVMRWYNFARCILLFIVSSLAVNLLAADNESAKPAPATRQEALPSAKEVLEKFAKELGGKEAFLKHQSQHAKGTIDMPAQQVKGT